MTSARRIRSIGVALSLAVFGTAMAADAPPASPQSRYQPSRRVDGYYKGQITPHWFAENTCFWYRNDLSGGTREFILANAGQGTRQPAFDHARLAAALSKAAGTEYHADRLPFDAIEFPDGDGVVRFAVDETTWDCDLASYACTKTDATMSQPAGRSDQEGSPFGRRRGGSGQRRDPSTDSPDGKWTALVKDYNVFVCAKEGGEEIPLSTDGVEGNAYGRLSWSPDSRTLVAFRIEPGDGKEVYLIESSPAEGGRARFSRRPYSLPGDRFTMYELNLFEIESRRQIKPEVDRLELDWQAPRLAGRAIRGTSCMRRSIAATSDCGSSRSIPTRQDRNLIDERSETFIWTALRRTSGSRWSTGWRKTDEIVYVSERDAGGICISWMPRKARSATRSPVVEWVVHGIDLIDEDTRQVWFHACGKDTDQDPYFLHYYRVNFDGSGLVALTGQRQSLDPVLARSSLPDRYVQPRGCAACAYAAAGLRRQARLPAGDRGYQRAAGQGLGPTEVFVARAATARRHLGHHLPSRDSTREEAPGDRVYLRRAAKLVRTQELQPHATIRVADRSGLRRGSDGRNGYCQPLEGLSRRLLAQPQGRRLPRPDSLASGSREEVPLVRHQSCGRLWEFRGRSERRGRGALPYGVLQSRRGLLRLSRQSHGQGLLERAVDGHPVGPCYAECSNIDNAHRSRASCS